MSSAVNDGRIQRTLVRAREIFARDLACTVVDAIAQGAWAARSFSRPSVDLAASAMKLVMQCFEQPVADIFEAPRDQVLAALDAAAERAATAPEANHLPSGSGGDQLTPARVRELAGRGEALAAEARRLRDELGPEAGQAVQDALLALADSVTRRVDDLHDAAGHVARARAAGR